MTLNLRSPAQVKGMLAKRGIVLDSTKKAKLMEHKDDPVVGLLLQHRELSKLYNSFVKPFLALPTLPYIHCRYNQVTYDQTHDLWEGIKSGRLSCSEPNLQQIPARTENGKLLRKLFVPREGYIFIVADYSQIELRLMAHFSQDPVLLDAYVNGKDIHEETAHSLNVDRFWGKTANFSIGYGCSKWKLAALLGTSEDKADQVINSYWKRFRILQSWRFRTIQEARKKGGVSTLFGRWIPIQHLNSSDFRERCAAEREAVSYLIQGSAADIIKMAMLKCKAVGYIPLITVHDELVFEVGIDGGDDATDVGYHLDQEQMKEAMENIVKLSVPLEVSIHAGNSWAEAKQ